MTAGKRPDPPIPVIDGRALGDPPWDAFVEMAIAMGATPDEARRHVAASRERYERRRVRH